MPKKPLYAQIWRGVCSSLRRPEGLSEVTHFHLYSNSERLTASLLSYKTPQGEDRSSSSRCAFSEERTRPSKRNQKVKQVSWVAEHGSVLMKYNDKKHEASRMNEERQGVFSDNIPSKGQYTGRQMCKAYLLPSTHCFYGTVNSRMYKGYRLYVYSRYLHDMEYDASGKGTTTVKACRSNWKAWIKNQPMHECVKKDLIGEIEHIWDTWNVGAPTRPSRRDE